MHIGTGTLVARDEDRIWSTSPVPTCARRSSTMCSLIPLDIPQNSMVGQRRQQKSELQFDNFPTHSTFLCWKIRFKNQESRASQSVPSCSAAQPSEAQVMMVDSGSPGSEESFRLCKQYTYRAPLLLVHWCTVVAQSRRSLAVIVYSHTLTPCTCMAQVTMHIVCVSPKKTHISSGSVVHVAALDDTTHGHSLTYS